MRSARGLLWLVVALLAVGVVVRVASPWVFEVVLEGPVLGGPLHLALDDVDLDLPDGSVAFQGLEVRDGPDGRALLRTERLRVGVALHDLPWRHLRVRAVEIDSPELSLRRNAEGELEILELLDEPDEETAPGGEGAAPDADPTPSEDEPWALTIEQLELEEGHVRFRDLSLAETGRWSARLDEIVLRRISLPPRAFEEPGELRVDGTVEGAPFSVVGRFEWADGRRRVDADLELSGLPLREARLYIEGLGWTAAEGRIDASLALDWPPEDDGSGVRVAGELALHDVRVTELLDEDDPHTEPCVVAWKRMALPVERATLSVPHGNGSAPRVRLGRVMLDGPELSLRRGPGDDDCVPGGSGGADEDADGRVVAMEMESLAIEGGRVAFLDRTVSPFIELELRSVEGEARSLRTDPELTLETFELRGAGAAETVALAGELGGERWRLDARIRRLELPPLNPYATRYTPYVARTGAASLELDATRAPDRLEADAGLVLHDLALADGGPAFRRRYGVPFPVAMALLRDLGGDVHLDLELARATENGVHVDVTGLLRTALQRALVNAITGPLRLLGAVVTRDGGIEAFVPEPIAFRPGRSTLTERGRDQIARLADVLARRPGLGVHLEPVRGAGDAGASAAPDASDAPRALPQTLDALDAARVAAVTGRLVGRHGVAPDRIEAVPAAEDRADGPEPGRPRVELSLLAVEEVTPAQPTGSDPLVPRPDGTIPSR